MSNVSHSSEKLVKANNIEINYDTFGDKKNPAILLIMGLACQMIFWKDEFCQNLASKGFFVIRFDNRDIGLSSKMVDLPIPNIMRLTAALQQGGHPEVPYKLSDMAKDTIELLDALQIEKFHVVGVSMGGMIAQTMAIEYPNRIKTLTSISSTTGNPQLPQAKPEAMAVLLTPPSPDKAKYIENEVKTWKVLYGPKYHFPEQYIRERAERVFNRNFYPAGIARQFAAIIGSEPRNKYLKDLQIPTLVIHGDADPLIPFEAGKDTANSIPGSKLLIIDGMGHSIPDEVEAQILEATIQNIKTNL